ncbi:MAG: hypothetical protein CBD77_04615 [bacterium TMED217]|nr:MAG: hypothetical protein CBD77_04615 [bacterium TMED217]
MMNKLPISTFIFFGFCLNIFLIIFLSDSNNIVNLALRLSAVAGIIWLIYFYFKYLRIEVENKHYVSLDVRDESINFDISAKNQFLDLINLTFTFIKEINIEFESAIYFIDPDSNNYKLNDSTSNNFNSVLLADSILISKIINENDVNILYQKDNPVEWVNLFQDESFKGSECVIMQKLLFNNFPAGLIIVRSNHFSDINTKDQLLIKHLSEIISLSIKDLDILEKTINRGKDQSRIFDLLMQINLTHSESEILNKFRNLIHYFFKYDCLTISRLDNQSNNAVIKLIDGVKKNLPDMKAFNINGTINGLPYIKKCLINSSSDKYNLFRYSSSEIDTDINNNFLSAPIFIDEKLWGGITIESFDNQRFNEHDEKLMLLIVNAIQTSMFWYIEYQNMYENAIKDGLTGLLNHKTFMDRSREEIERARRFQHNLVFLMYDLDKFKRINDTLGHPYGDYVIKTTAKIIKDNVRSIDLVARYGGEEFAVVLVNTNTEAALTVAERIVENIADYNFIMEENEVNMTISSGLSEYPNDSDQLKDLIRFADEGLYNTKENGGNSVTIYHSMNK